ncbi:HD domain-containing protein [Nodosilinea sp. LEGE 06152]|uniref:HD domain-containing protein n=1 Tax=Nodosilinea sp. LEGE 06152 TaxID=2777966 RepID=UPI00187DF337|nr:HD domain-containing protein [Nodosilinea sp. LEGE 06152]MBE9159333.1 HD domain-containing protein [Nodosilinea sp. LEGE 06152]
MTNQRLQQQIAFVVEIDRLKQVLRQTQLMDASRRENSAEHSWHLAMMVLVLAEYAPAGVDVQHAMHQVLIHDLVEIDAGDTFCYDTAGHHDKADREQRAADRIFGLLPTAGGNSQSDRLRQLWDEFEAQATPTARFAAALDRIQPLLHNWQTGGGTWKQHGICRAQVMQRMAPVETGAPALWPFVLGVIEDCVTAGYLQS